MSLRISRGSIFKVSIPTSVITLVVSETSCCLVAILQRHTHRRGALRIFPDGGQRPVAYRPGGRVVIVGLYFNDLYEDFRIKSRILLVQQTSVMLGLAFVLQAVLSYATVRPSAAQVVMVYGSGLCWSPCPAGACCSREWSPRRLARSGCCFSASRPRCSEIVAQIAERPDLGLKAVGYLDAPEAMTQTRFRPGQWPPSRSRDIAYGAGVASVAAPREIHGVPGTGNHQGSGRGHCRRTGRTGSWWE